MGSRLPAQRSPVRPSGRMPPDRLGRWIAKARFSRWTLAARLTAIVLALAVPLNLVILVSVWRLAEAENQAQRSNLQDMARSIAAAVDAELREYIVLGQALSRSPALLDDDFAAFEAEAARAFASIPHAWIMVADPEGRELTKTAGRQPGSWREAPEMAAQKRAFETHAIAFGGVHISPIRKEWAVSIEMPVFKDGQPFRELAVSIETREFLHLFSDRRLPPNWLGGILDGEGHFIARVPGHVRHSDQLAKDWREAKDRDGAFEFISAGGDPIALANAHSALTGWPVEIAVEKTELEAAAWSATRWVAIPGAVLSALSLLLAGAICRGISGPIVTEQVEARRTLIEKESLRRLGDALPDSIVYRYGREPGGMVRFHYISAGIEKLHGLQAEEVLRDASVLTNQMLPQYRQLLIGAEERSAREMSDLEIEFEIRRPDGEVRWLCIKSRPEKTPDGRVTWEGIATDITARKLAQEALRESEERLRLSNEAAGIGAFTIDMETRLTSYSPELSAILGVPGVQTASVEAALARVHRDDVDFVRAKFDAAAAGADFRPGENGLPLCKAWRGSSLDDLDRPCFLPPRGVRRPLAIPDGRRLSGYYRTQTERRAHPVAHARSQSSIQEHTLAGAGDRPPNSRNKTRRFYRTLWRAPGIAGGEPGPARQERMEGRSPRRSRSFPACPFQRPAGDAHSCSGGASRCVRIRRTGPGHGFA